METTIDLEPEAYRVAQTVAVETKQSLGKVVSEAIMSQHRVTSFPNMQNAGTEIDEYGWPVIRFGRPITSEDVKALIEED